MTAGVRGPRTSGSGSWLGALVVVGSTACGPHGGTARPTPAPTVDDLIARLAKARDQLTSFVADAQMDYWLGNQRVKGEVLIMGELGAKIRFAALSPAGGSTMAEMACDGTNFVYVDYQNNCTLSGPCDERSIAQFFHIDLQPDDFVHLALGTPPVLAGAQGAVTWDGDKALEKLELHAAGGEKLTIDDKDSRFDVLAAEMAEPDGKVAWSVTNADFVAVAGHRVPGKTRFQSPANKQDLSVDWGPTESRQVDPQLAAAKFQLTAPQGLPQCGQQAPSGSGQGTAPAAGKTP
jgi:hypothetical protein